MDLLVLNDHYEIIGVVDTYESVIWTDRYDECGDFELKLPVNSKHLDLLRINRYLWLKESEHSMIIEDISIDESAEEGNSLTITGRSLESILERRIIWGQLTLKGNFQESIERILNECFINPADSNRKIPNMVFRPSNDPNITGLTLDIQCFGDNVYELISKICKERRIGFKIELNSDNQFEFQLYCGVNRSYSQTENPYVVFSPSFDNMISSNYFSSNSKERNAVLIGGEGDGSEKKIESVGTTTGMARKELYVESGISSNTQDGKMTEEDYRALMRANGEKALSENKAITAFEGEAEVSSMFTYGTDFFIGDIVQMSDLYGHEGSSYISELVFSKSDSGFQAYPTFKSCDVKEG